MPLDYYVWAIHRDQGPPIVVDTGFGAEAALRRGRTILRPVAQGLRDAGVDIDAVEDVIVTHMHYDHAGSLDIFPNARFHIQDAEMAFCTGRAMGNGAIRAPFDVEPVTEMVRHVFAERVVFHAGSESIAPGIQVTTPPATRSGCSSSRSPPPAAQSSSLRIPRISTPI